MPSSSSGRLRRRPSRPTTSMRSAVPYRKRVTIRVQPAAIRDITQTVSATGKIRPEVEGKISPEVAGEIIELPVIDGQEVKKGDLLVKIRPDNYIAQVRQAEAGLSSAQADSLERKSQMLNDQLDYRRSQELFQKRLISETDFKAAQTKSLRSDAAYESSLHQDFDFGPIRGHQRLYAEEKEITSLKKYNS